MMTYPANANASGAARSGVAPVCLLDVQTVDGFIYQWSDRPISNVPAAISPDGLSMNGDYQPWLMQPPTFTFYRSLQTDAGSFILQNVSGDTVSSDFEKVARRGALEGALFVFRWWQAGGEFAWLEVHGTLTVKNVTKQSVELGTVQPLTGNDDTPVGAYSESCQLIWAQKRCGATGATECLYSYTTCQVIEHYVGILNTYEKNFEETLAPVVTPVVNRRRGL